MSETEHGYYHPDRGFWQTVGGPVPIEVLASYPEGTLVVPLKPGADYAFIDGAWVYAPTPPAQAELLKYAAAKRRALASGSTTIVVGTRNVPAWVDAESRGAIVGLVVASGVVPALTAPWKGADGEFYTLDASEMVALALGMMAFVQACFDAEAAVVAQITADPPTITTFADIDAVAWPT